MSRKAPTPYRPRQSFSYQSYIAPPLPIRGRSHLEVKTQSQEAQEGPPDHYHQDPSGTYRRVQIPHSHRDPTNHAVLNLATPLPPSYATTYHTNLTDHYRRRHILHEAAPRSAHSDQTSATRKNRPQLNRAPIQQSSSEWPHYLLLSLNNSSRAAHQSQN